MSVSDPEPLPLTKLATGVWASGRSHQTYIVSMASRKMFVLLVVKQYRATPARGGSMCGGSRMEPRQLLSQVRQLLDKRNPLVAPFKELGQYMEGTNSESAGWVVALEVPWGGIVGIDYLNPLHADGRLVLEAKSVTKRVFDSLSSTEHYYSWSPDRAAATNPSLPEAVVEAGPSSQDQAASADLVSPSGPRAQSSRSTSPAPFHTKTKNREASHSRFGTPEASKNREVSHSRSETTEASKTREASHSRFETPQRSRWKFLSNSPDRVTWGGVAPTPRTSPVRYQAASRQTPKPSHQGLGSSEVSPAGCMPALAGPVFKPSGAASTTADCMPALAGHVSTPSAAVSTSYAMSPIQDSQSSWDYLRTLLRPALTSQAPASGGQVASRQLHQPSIPMTATVNSPEQVAPWQLLGPSSPVTPMANIHVSEIHQQLLQTPRSSQDQSSVRGVQGVEVAQSWCSACSQWVPPPLSNGASRQLSNVISHRAKPLDVALMASSPQGQQGSMLPARTQQGGMLPARSLSEPDLESLVLNSLAGGVQVAQEGLNGDLPVPLGTLSTTNIEVCWVKPTSSRISKAPLPGTKGLGPGPAGTATWGGSTKGPGPRPAGSTTWSRRPSRRNQSECGTAGSQVPSSRGGAVRFQLQDRRGGLGQGYSSNPNGPDPTRRDLPASFLTDAAKQQLPSSFRLQAQGGKPLPGGRRLSMQGHSGSSVDLAHLAGSSWSEWDQGGGLGMDIPAPSRWTSASAVYYDRTLVLNFKDPILHPVLRRFVKSDLRLLRLYESGLPPWAVFLPSYGFWYRPWLRQVTKALFLALSVVSMLFGFYDLYKNIPFVKQVVSATLLRIHLPSRQIMDWLEHHTQIRLSILLTWMFSRSALATAVMALLRSATAVVAELLAPLAAAAAQPLAVIVKVGGACIRPVRSLVALLAGPLIRSTWSMLLSILRLLALLGSHLRATLQIVTVPALLLAQATSASAALARAHMSTLMQALAAMLLSVRVLLANCAVHLMTLGRVLRSMGKVFSAGSKATEAVAPLASATSSGWLWKELLATEGVLHQALMRCFKALQSVLKFLITLATTVIKHRVSLKLQARYTARRAARSAQISYHPGNNCDQASRVSKATSALHCAAGGAEGATAYCTALTRDFAHGSIVSTS
eukprot:gene14123-20079_t